MWGGRGYRDDDQLGKGKGKYGHELDAKSVVSAWRVWVG